MEGKAMLQQSGASEDIRGWGSRLEEIGTTTRDEGKLGPRWEGQYMVTATNRPGTYRLKDSQGNELPHP